MVRSAAMPLLTHRILIWLFSLHRLTYWTVFGFLHLIEFFSDLLLYWMPFYFLVKMGFLLYLLLPQTRVRAISNRRMHGMLCILSACASSIPDAVLDLGCRARVPHRDPPVSVEELGQDRQCI